MAVMQKCLKMVMTHHHKKESVLRQLQVSKLRRDKREWTSFVSQPPELESEGPTTAGIAHYGPTTAGNAHDGPYNSRHRRRWTSITTGIIPDRPTTADIAPDGPTIEGIAHDGATTAGIAHTDLQQFKPYLNLSWLCKRYLMRYTTLSLSVSIWVQLFNHWQQGFLQDTHVCHCIHASLKDANSWPALLADYCPYMNFCWMHWSWFAHWFKAWLGAAELSMGLYLYSCFIWNRCSLRSHLLCSPLPIPISSLCSHHRWFGSKHYHDMSIQALCNISMQSFPICDDHALTTSSASLLQ